MKQLPMQLVTDRCKDSRTTGPLSDKEVQAVAISPGNEKYDLARLTILRISPLMALIPFYSSSGESIIQSSHITIVIVSIVFCICV